MSCTHHEHDFAALSAASTRVISAAGAASEGQLAHRAAVAQLPGNEPLTFPGDQGGFLGGEYGVTGGPDAFAAALRQVLTVAGWIPCRRGADHRAVRDDVCGNLLLQRSGGVSRPALGL
ncbi:hypothetical protein [Blastococcus mobilis]|uniref:Uncharacterized protein n=1 Tax=Blastococcus mobilis TaxID=1938746 RepID=A0A238ZTQ2_9ACTN|nr:hypothetical protein [Blastococcus mobilis]SNR86599.1 hypothetical protein SAMN06272737_13315 [Blastococcus mobilis]